MEKGTFGRGLKRSLVGLVLAGGLLLGGIGTKEANAQDARGMANRLEYESTWSGQSAKDKQILQGAAYFYKQQANLDAQDEAKKARLAMEEQIELLKKMEKQNRERNTAPSYQATESKSSSMTLEEANRILDGVRARENLEYDQDTTFYNQEKVFTCNEWIDGYNGEPKNGSVTLHELIGFEKKTFEQGEKITVIVKAINRKKELLRYSAFKDNKPLFNREIFMPGGNNCIFMSFSDINPKPGRYQVMFTLGRERFGEVEFTVE